MNNCNCAICKELRAVQKAIRQKINNGWNKANLQKRFNIARIFFETLIDWRDQPKYLAIIEMLGLKLLSIEKFNKSLGLLSKEEISILTDIMIKPHLNKKMHDDILEFFLSKEEYLKLLKKNELFETLKAELEE